MNSIQHCTRAWSPTRNSVIARQAAREEHDRDDKVEGVGRAPSSLRGPSAFTVLTLRLSITANRRACLPIRSRSSTTRWWVMVSNGPSWRKRSCQPCTLVIGWMRFGSSPQGAVGPQDVEDGIHHLADRPYPGPVCLGRRRHEWGDKLPLRIGQIASIT